MMVPLIITMQRGLGDNIYARPFIRAATKRHDVFLDTPWPELFEDLNVKFVQPVTRLRTQAKNVARHGGREWVVPPSGVRIKLGYGAESLRKHGSIIRTLRGKLPLHNAPFVFDLPDTGSSPIGLPGRPIAFIRPVTSRSEWLNTARNPRPEYIFDIACRLMDTHHVVLVADIDKDNEWLEGHLPPHHAAYIRGELNIKEIIALLRRSHVAVGGVGWIVPAAIAVKAPAFIVLGGQGGHNAPSVITDPAMDLSQIHFASPKDYCRCTDMKHNCEKSIPDLAEQWSHFATSHGLLRSP